MAKSPAYQRYSKDYLSSVRVQMMTLAEEGAYNRLLEYCWIQGHIPADAQKAARLVGKGCSVEMAKVCLEMFEPHPDDAEKLIHDRLEVERAKQEHNSIARKKASDARWNKQGKSEQNSKSGKPADVRGTRDEADNRNGKQVKPKPDANGYANALQTESIAITTPVTNTFSNEKDIGGGKKPPTEKQDAYLERKQLEYPQLDVQAIFKRYITDCKKKGIQPKRPFFDSWLDNEYEPLTADFETKSDLPTTEEVQKQREKERENFKNSAPAL